MIKSLFPGLFAQQPEPLPEADSRLALAVLLVRVGRADEDYSEEEQERTDMILSTRFQLPPAEASELRQEAEQLESEVADNVSFTKALKNTVPFEERVGLVEALWEVAMADERRDYTEDGYLRLAAKLLGVNDRDSVRARQRVIARMR
ncbi:MAG: TerB family tellurite resistance protein [Rhodobacteraceae bacterium]|nr:TerB family tellurite resistance protein [Paracoccaceae bacterium]